VMEPTSMETCRAGGVPGNEKNFANVA